jgi:glycosyltransferase involved in cell wall biosynthesis
VSDLRLLAVIEAYSITGPAKNLLEFARLARGAGVETTLATFTRGAPTNLFIETARQGGISVETILERGAYDPAVLPTLKSLVDRVRPDIIQTHAVKSHFLARRARLFERARWIAFHHGYTWTSPRARLYSQLDRWSLRAAQQVLTVSIPFREELAAKGVRRERIEIVHNAIPPDWGGSARENSAVLRAQLGISPDNKVILIVGRLSLEKDHLTLLEAIHRLDPSLSPRVVIVGDGPERPRIEERIRSLNLSATATLTGQQNSAEPYYGIADVAVLSSRSEGSPNALLEAMAAGVPIVATRVGGIPEMVADKESALLVAPGDASAMTAAISRLLQDSALAQRLVDRSRELIRLNHAPEARTRELIGLYRAVLKSPL